MQVVYTEKLMSYRHGGEKLADGKENRYHYSLNLGIPETSLCVG